MTRNRSEPGENVASLSGKDTSVWPTGTGGEGPSPGRGPGRGGHGIALKEQKARLPVVHWLEIYNKKWWQALDPVSGAPGLPDNTWPGERPPFHGQVNRRQRPAPDPVRHRELEAAISTAVVRGQIKKPLLL